MAGEEVRVGGYKPASLEEIRYKCGRCGMEFSSTDLSYMPSIKCPYCGYRVIYKVRPLGSKVVRAI